MNAKALMKFMERYRIETVEADGHEGIAVVDVGGDPLVVTAILFDQAGMPVAGRAFFEGDRAGESATDLLEGNTDSIGKTMPLSSALDFFGLRGRRSSFAHDVATGFLVTNAGRGTDRSMVEDAALSLLKAEGIDAIAARLDGAALEALSCISTFERPAYAFYALPGEKGEMRRQAAAMYPLLAGEIAQKILVKLAVDQGKSLPDALMKSFGSDEFGAPRMSKGILKRLINQTLPDGGLPIATIVNALSEIPVDWFPKNAVEWGAFLDISDSFFRRLAPDLGVKAGAMANGVSGKWSEFANRLARSYAWTQVPEELPEEEKKLWTPAIDVSRQAMTEAAENARDVIQAFRNYIVLPLAANAGNGIPVFVGPEQLRQANDVAAMLLYGGKSLTKVLELQRHWHTQAHNMRAATDVQRGVIKTVADDGWPPLCDIVEAPNGVQIYPLTDPRELVDEGAQGLNHPGLDRNGIRGLGHCVGSHAAGCRSGKQHIVSLRVPGPNDTFERLSTAEWSALGPESVELHKIQHYGIRNSLPSALSQEAYDWFVTSVRDRQIPINHEGIMSYIAGRRRVAEEVEAYSDYDWRDQEIIAAALDPWRPYLPNKLRDLDVESFQGQSELRDLIQSLAPSFGYSPGPRL